MKLLRYRDAGFDCDHEVRAESEEELLQQVAEHASTVHQAEVTPELVEQVKSLIQEEEPQVRGVAVLSPSRSGSPHWVSNSRR